jgi:cytochrome c556
MKNSIVASIAAVILFSTSHAFAQLKPEDAIKFRRAAFNVMGFNFGTIGAMANNRAPYDQAKAEQAANALTAVIFMPYGLFPAGTDKGDTRVKPEYFQNVEKAKGYQDKMRDEVVKLAQVVKSGDQAAIKVQFGETGKSCKSCHDDFRKE